MKIKKVTTWDYVGMWLMHCHLERHQVWGMSMVFLVKNGHARDQKIVRPPHDLPKCYH